jgi:asparagine synthase (glutamine-hydrolysing)
MVTGRWWRWLAEANGMRRREEASGRELVIESLYLAAPPALRRAYLRREDAVLSPAVLSPALCAAVGLEDRLRRSGLEGTWQPGRVFRRAQMGVGGVAQIGPVMTAISEPWRRRGITLTHPWSDRRLMSFCMGLPYQRVCPQGRTKVVLRDAMAERLPPEILGRPHKANLAGASERAAYGPNLPYVRTGFALAREQPEWFDRAAVDTLEADFERGYSVAGALRLAMFASWVRWCEAA